jgi:hypothetical protein
MKHIIPSLIIVLSFGTLIAQDDYIELLRKNVTAEKTAVITEVMALSDSESTIFWPLYREYDFERSKIDDQRVALVKDYADHFENVTNEKADEITKRSFKYRRQLVKLEQKYYKKMARALSPTTAARFFQLENQLNSLITLQITSNLPLIEH